MTTALWTLTTDDGDTLRVEADDFEAAEIELADWIGDNYPSEARTYWVRAYVTSPEGRRTFVRVEVEPSEPECSEDDHDWVDGPIYGSGGGVAWTSKCRHCGLRRRTDTWASDPQDGSQGHASVEYLPAD